MKKIVGMIVLFVLLIGLTACAENSELVSSEQVNVQALVFGERQETPSVELPERYVIFHKEFGTLFQFKVFERGIEICSSTDSFSDPRQWQDTIQPFYISSDNCTGLPVDLIITWDIANAEAGGWKIFFQVGDGEFFPAT